MKISQREARRLKKRVEELEQQRRQERMACTRNYPGGQHLGSLTLGADLFRGRLEGAQLLQHPLVVVLDGAQCKFYALKAD